MSIKLRKIILSLYLSKGDINKTVSANACKKVKSHFMKGLRRVNQTTLYLIYLLYLLPLRSKFSRPVYELTSILMLNILSLQNKGFSDKLRDSYGEWMRATLIANFKGFLQNPSPRLYASKLCIVLNADLWIVRFSSWVIWVQVELAKYWFNLRASHEQGDVSG